MSQSVEKMFEVAVRTKMRFPFRGLISVEDLWDLTVQQLDSIYKTLNAELKKVQEESLLDTKTTANKELELKVDIIKYIVSVKQQEAKTQKEAKETREKRQKILGIIAAKEEANLENLSIEELTAMANDLK